MSQGLSGKWQQDELRVKCCNLDCFLTASLFEGADLFLKERQSLALHYKRRPLLLEVLTNCLQFRQMPVFVLDQLLLGGLHVLQSGHFGFLLALLLRPQAISASHGRAILGSLSHGGGERRCR